MQVCRYTEINRQEYDDVTSKVDGRWRVVWGWKLDEGVVSGAVRVL